MKTYLGSLINDVKKTIGIRKNFNSQITNHKLLIIF